MPRQHEPPSLRKASIENIVCHFEDVWFAWSTSDLLESSGQSDVFTPFQYLYVTKNLQDRLLKICTDRRDERKTIAQTLHAAGDDMIQEIIDMLVMRTLVDRRHFHLLLHSNIRCLDLTGLTPAFKDTQYLINTIGSRCQKLTHLRLRGLGTVKSELMCTLVRHLPHIVSLCLNNTRLDANFIKAISENCPHLLELDLAGCKLEDKSLLYLCNYPEHPNARLKLRKLLVGRIYNLSTDIVVHLLKNQTSLQCLGTCDLIDHAFVQMYGEGFRSLKEVPVERVHNLSEITIKGSSGGNLNPNEAARLDLTFQCCPYLTKLTLTRLREGESLHNVAKLKHLKTLIVNMDLTVDFSTYVTPVLTKIGGNLTDLVCEGFDEVSLILIGKSCPNLDSLGLHHVSLVSEQHPRDIDVTQSISYFANLKVISIFPRSGNFHSPTNIDANVLCLLLQNATKLEECTFVSVINMTDSVISEANRKHGFRYLKKCRFALCDSISMESLRVLFCPDNPLETLIVDSCQNITIQDMSLIRQEAKLKQFNINFMH